MIYLHVISWVLVIIICHIFSGSFTAKKLASVVVHIADQSSGEKLPGQLIFYLKTKVNYLNFPIKFFTRSHDRYLGRPSFRSRTKRRSNKLMGDLWLFFSSSYSWHLKAKCSESASCMGTLDPLHNYQTSLFQSPIHFSRLFFIRKCSNGKLCVHCRGCCEPVWWRNQLQDQPANRRVIHSLGYSFFPVSGSELVICFPL